MCLVLFDINHNDKLYYNVRKYSKHVSFGMHNISSGFWLKTENVAWSTRIFAIHVANSQSKIPNQSELSHMNFWKIKIRQKNDIHFMARLFALIKFPIDSFRINRSDSNKFSVDCFDVYVTQ